ncbi:lipid-binding protein [Algibacter pectinivorans]|uniref:Lipid-binding putative hydrolase n=1 Tax=Algibacter pectinivorans TaxID=870482 RepID=A0A1I1MAQ5_9FLAO|nr:lipid-binding protein [Algibacter pectinivorans]SFC82469.1 Lipid-binding putative hydrolase [Algibacter pectinivorans]
MKHNIILKKLSYLFFSIVMMASFTACEGVESEPDASDIVIEEVTGSWYIIGLETDGETPAFAGDYVLYDIYNSSENNFDFWIDDHNTFFQLKSKGTVDLSSLTFSSEANTAELYTGETVTISNGQITKDSFTTASNTVVDAIYFEAEFSWDPGTVYIFKGHKRTGFVGDDNPHYE